MAKQLNVNLAFNADTSQAKAQIQALQKSLQDIAKLPGSANNLFDDTQIKKASQAALELQQHLSKAVNVDTGKLDLSRFSSSLKASNKDLNSYCNTLLSTGQQGQQTFLQLAQAIATADTPVTRINKKLAEMGTTLKNTARWQISSSILHGFMGAIQSAYGYAQDLNESLNNIRIVTGQSVDQMEKFAEKANRAARALSATTTEYTNASLIYYQQGLSDSEVAERTEITIKMANAAGQSAQVVSDQMTAVWNNFDNGSKSLEYYADVMTALGAATASSTDEIAEGLNKFAAVADTVGLSYEYAASALATVTATTRQSADVVGTAFKTLFARIQDLELGKTLDDGTTLGTYSQALAKVGIDIKNTSGQMKNMDQILEEMAVKWDTLGKAEQTALAQNVAGVRQYTQLIALMDNWDFMEENLATSTGASGTLDRQADIYAESWEAAQDRVTAAAENIYQSLLDDKFFISLLNGFEKVLETIGGLIDGLGGLKGVFSVVGSIFLTTFANKMPETLSNLRQNFMVFTGQAQKAMVEIQDAMSAEVAVQKVQPGTSESFKLQAEGIESVSKMKQKLILESKHLTTQERAAYEARIKNVEAMYDEAAALAKVADEQNKQSKDAANTLIEGAAQDAQGLINKHSQAGQNKHQAESYALAAASNDDYLAWEKYTNDIAAATQAQDLYNQKIDKMVETYAKLGVEGEIVNASGNIDPNKQKEMAAAVEKVTEQYKEQITQRKKLDVLQSDLNSQTKDWKKYAKEIDKSEKAVKELKVSMGGYKDVIQNIAKQAGVTFPTKAIEKLDAALKNPKASAEDCARAFEEFAAAVGPELKARLDTLDQDLAETDTTLDNLGLSKNNLDNMKSSAENAAEGVTKLALSTGNIKGQVDAGIDSTFKASVAFTQFGATAMSVSSTINSIQNMISVFSDEGATGFEKMGAAISVLVAVMSAYNAVMAFGTTLKKIDTSAETKNALAKMANALSSKVAALFTKTSIATKTAETGAVWANTAAWYANPIMWIALIIIGVIAAIAGLIAIFSKLNDVIAANSAEGKLKAAKETASELSVALDAAKQKADDLKSAFDSYDSVTEKLAECEKGTREWTEALQAVNNEVLNLIKKYPELSTMVNSEGESAITYGDSGEMIIADWARDSLIAAANNDVLVAQAASVAANQKVREHEVAVDEQKAVDRAKLDNTQAQTAFDRAYEKYGSTMTKENYKSELSAYLEGQGLSWDADRIDSWGDSALELAKAMSELDAAMQQNTAATEAENRAIAASTLFDNTIVQSSELSKDVLNVSGHLYDQLNKEAMAALKNSGWGTKGIAQISVDNEEAERIFAEYAEAAGLTNYELTDTTGNDNNRKFVYTNENGEEQTVSLDAMRMTKASFDAMQELDSAAQQLTSKFEYLATQTDDAGRSFAGLQTFLANQNFFQATGSELTDIKAQAAEAGGVEAYLDKMIGNGDGDLTDMTVQKYGFESAAEMVKAYEKELAEVEKQWAKVKETIPDTIKGIQDISLESAQALANDYKELAAGPQGDEAVAALTERLQYLEKQMSPEKYQEFMEQIGSVDWSNWNALDDVKTILDNLGISLDLTGDKWEEFTNKMRIAGAANPADHFNNIKNALSDLGDAIKGVNPGDSIDETQYQALITLNKDLADSFIQTADGYKYIGTEQLDVNNLNLADDLKEMNEAAKVYNNAKTSYEKSSISKMANSIFDTTNYGAEADKLASEIAGKFAAKEKELGKGAGGGWYGKDDKAKAAEYKKGLEEEVAQKRKQQEEANKRNDQLKTDLKKMGNDILADESLMEVAKAMHYDEAQIQEMISSGNYEGLQKLAKNVSTYMQEGLAGAYDSTELQEKMAATATTVNELNQMMYDGLITDTEVYQKQLTALTMDGIINAENLSQLQEAMQSGGDYSYQLVADALIRLGSEYENCSQEIDMFEQAIASSDEAAIQSAQDELEAAIMLGEAAEKYGVSAEEMEIQASQMAKTYGISTKAAAKMAIENQRMNEGVSELAENWSAWKDELSKLDKTTTDYAKAAAALTKTVAKLVGASEDLELSPEFLETPDNLKLIEKAAEGDIDAINELGLAVAADTIKLIELDSAITRTLENGTTKEISLARFENAKNTVLEGIQDLQTQVANGSISVGQSIGSMGADWANSLNEMAMATGMSVEEMNSMLSSMGVDAEVVTEYVQQKTKVPVYRTEMKNKYDDKGTLTAQETQTNIVRYEEMDGVIPVAQINMGETGDKPNVKFIGNGNVSSSSTSSSGSKTSDAKAKKSDLVDRYKEIDDKIDDSTRAMDRASKAADRLYGPARLKQMEKINEALKEEIGHLKEKRNEAELYLEEDKTALGKALDGMDMGLQFTLDKNGNISNYEDVMTQIYNKRESLLKSFGAIMDEEEKKRLDDFDNKADELKDAISQYDETRELIEDINDEIDDKWNEWQDNNYEQLHYKLELEIEIDDRELAWLDHQLNKIADDFYKMGESAALTSSKLNIYTDGFETDNGFFNQLQAQYNTFNADGVRTISQADYIAGMQEVYDGAIADAEAIRELDKTMLDYYSNTLSMAGEELAEYTDRMEHQTSVLEHYRNIMDIIGEPTNYEAIGAILEGQSKTIENEMEVSKKNYEMLSEEAKKKKQLLTDALARGDAEAAEVYQREWEAAEAAAREAQETMLSKTEEWAEAMKAVLENKLAGLAQTLENALTGGTSFDTLSTQMERAASLQEEYLTTTNKIYETNKMINTAQQAIDKTTNTVAKQRLKNFQQETAQLQNKSKLSQYELDIQQAKYDLLLAEIALEEAQSAKSTVRLQRDSEGNFGYVYTADANQVSDAEQKVADAQNALYNKGLEGANDYAQKYQETMQEMYDTLTDLQTRYLNGEFETEEEYHQAMEEAKAYYYQKLQNYSSLYRIATTTDSRVIADAWSSDFADMIYSTETWKSNVEDYLSNVNLAFGEWETTVAKLKNETIGNDLTELKTKVEDITTESDNLTTALTKKGGVIDGMQSVITEVSSATSAWAAQRKEILDLTTAYDNLALAAKEVLDATSLEGDDDNTKPENNLGGSVGGDNGQGDQSTLEDKYKLHVYIGASTKTGATYLSAAKIVKADATPIWTDIYGNDLVKPMHKVEYIHPTDGTQIGYITSEGWTIRNKYRQTLASLDTGGYTGSWGSEGKMAMLHEKELILNADDTTNFLASLEVLREIVNTINLHSMNAQLGGLLSTPHWIGTDQSQILEQQVHIEASFPGVQDRNEIEEAFNNLINRASQFVNRK